MCACPGRIPEPAFQIGSQVLRPCLFNRGEAVVGDSGLEQTQNAMRLSWTREEVDVKLQEIMRKIHDQCVAYGKVGDHIDYVKGANLAGFVKVADAMLAYGVM